MDVSVKQFNKICRVCLNECTNMKSLFSKVQGEERSLQELLAFTAHIHVKLEDMLPKQVCDECESLMCKADAFKRRCQESDTILNNILSQNANKHTDPSLPNTKCLIKDETCDSKLNSGKFDPYQPSNSSKCYYQDGFDKKGALLEELTISSVTDSISNKLSDSKVSDHSEQVVKVEIMANIDEHDDFSDHYDTGLQIETSPIQYDETTVKYEFDTYTCCCGKQFDSKVKLKAHTKETSCNKYKNVFEKLSNKILKIIPIKNNLQCSLCDCKLKTPSAWKQHQQRHRDENVQKKPLLRIYQCSLCLRNYKSKTSLSKHIQKHEQPQTATNSTKHICEICKREFKYKAYLENHILSTHSKNNNLTCSICAKSFVSQEDLQIHKNSHQNERKHQCKVCNKIFFMLSTLKEHLRTHTGEKPFLCSQCGRGFSQKNNLGQHMRRHQGLKPFKCENCDKRFVSKGELDAHSRKHSGAHPFVCDECGNGFTTSSSLVKHRRTHNGERPYQCDLCPMRFAASGTLKNHRRTHTGERPYQCSYCEKAFVQKNDLVSHIRCHTGERPYVCTQCGQSFRKASGLKTHVKMHGKELPGVNMSVLQGVNALLNGQCNEQ